MHDQRDLPLGGLAVVYEHSLGTNRYDDRRDRRGSEDDVGLDTILLVGAENTHSRERRIGAITKTDVPVRNHNSILRPPTDHRGSYDDTGPDAVLLVGAER